VFLDDRAWFWEVDEYSVDGLRRGARLPASRFLQRVRPVNILDLIVAVLASGTLISV
jgi:hypothetical protein